MVIFPVLISHQTSAVVEWFGAAFINERNKQITVDRFKYTLHVITVNYYSLYFGEFGSLLGLRPWKPIWTKVLLKMYFGKSMNVIYKSTAKLTELLKKDKI